MRSPLALAALVLGLILSLISGLSAQPAPALKIVVLEGEGAVNIIQQKTAVRPLVEIRDRNNLPVVGASVTFTVGGGQGAAFAGGAQTLTITTNAAGQAAASGLNAISSGAIQIQVQAAYQGQLATAAISQTNFATAAAAAQAGAGAGAGSSTSTGAASGAAGGGGGMSGTTIGIVGAAVGGGALAATTVGKDDSDDGNGTSNSGSSSNSFDGYHGPFTGQITENSNFTNTQGGSSNCSFASTLTGNLTIELKRDGTGAAGMTGTTTQIAASSTCIPDPTPRGLSLLREETPVTGGPSAITFNHRYADVLKVIVFSFSGSLTGNTISGTLSLNVSPAPNANPRYTGATTMPVTLTGPRP
jgi:hypothetical protein